MSAFKEMIKTWLFERARRRMQGTTGQSASPPFLERSPSLEIFKTHLDKVRCSLL